MNRTTGHDDLVPRHCSAPKTLLDQTPRTEFGVQARMHPGCRSPAVCLRTRSRAAPSRLRHRPYCRCAASLRRKSRARRLQCLSVGHRHAEPKGKAWRNGPPLMMHGRHRRPIAAMGMPGEPSRFHVSLPASVLAAGSDGCCVRHHSPRAGISSRSQRGRGCRHAWRVRRRWRPLARQ